MSYNLHIFKEILHTEKELPSRVEMPTRKVSYQRGEDFDSRFV